MPRLAPVTSAIFPDNALNLTRSEPNSCRPSPGCLKAARAIDQRLAVDLVGAGPWQFVDEFDAPWVLIGRPVGDGELANVIETRLRMRAGHDKGDGDLASLLVRKRNHRRLLNLGMALQQFLHFARIDILARADEHIVGTTNEIVKPVVVAPHHVAAIIPAVDQRFGGLLRQIVIISHQRGIAHQKDTFVLRAADELEILDVDRIAERERRGGGWLWGGARTPRAPRRAAPIRQTTRSGERG